MHDPDRNFLTAVWLLIVVSLLATAYVFLVRMDYNFIVEIPCDSAEQLCYYRDCSAQECPVNGRETYRLFSVRAADHERCTDDACIQECSKGTIACVEIICGESPDDECAEQETATPIL
jgi:hypothetical protein